MTRKREYMWIQFNVQRLLSDYVIVIYFLINIFVDYCSSMGFREIYLNGELLDIFVFISVLTKNTLSSDWICGRGQTSHESHARRQHLFRVNFDWFPQVWWTTKSNESLDANIFQNLAHSLTPKICNWWLTVEALFIQVFTYIGKCGIIY